MKQFLGIVILSGLVLAGCAEPAPLPGQHLFYDRAQGAYYGDGTDCEVDLALQKVGPRGGRLRLDDGRRFAVHAADAGRAAAWQPGEQVTVCFKKLILNLDRGERVRVKLLK